MKLYFRQVAFDLPDELQDIEYVKVLNGSHGYEIKDGIITLFHPGINRQTYKYNKIVFTYNDCKYRLLNLEPTTLSIIIFRGDYESKVVDTDTSRLILCNEKELDFIDTIGLNSTFIIKEDENVPGYTYSTFESIKLTNGLEFIGEGEVLDIESKRLMYSSDMTVILSNVYKFWKNYLKDEFSFVNEFSKTDQGTSRDVFYIKYDEWLQDFTRFLPWYNNEIQEMKLPFTVRLVTNNISKYERLVAEIRSLRYITNVVRISDVVDKLNVEWNIPIKWSESISTSQVEQPNNGSFVTYEVSVSGVMTLYNILNKKYSIIETIINEQIISK